MTVHVAEGVWAAGVLVQSGPPLGTVWIPLDSGLTVLYGRNGAGKSRLLDAVGRALRGVALQDGHVSLHVEFGGPFEFFDEQLLVELADLAGIDVPSPSDIWAERENGDETRPLVNTVCGALSELLVERAHGFGFGDGICHTPRVALEAVGTDVAPAWRVSLSVVPTEPSTFIEHNLLGDQLTRLANVSRPTATTRGFVHLGTVDGSDDIVPLIVAEIPARLSAAEMEDFTEGQAFFPYSWYDTDSRQLDASEAISCRTADDTLDLEQVTVQLARGSRRTPLIDGCTEDDVAWHPDVVHRLDDLSLSANLVLRSLTGDELASLVIDHRHPNRWPDEAPLSWWGADLVGTHVPVSELGAGSQRWARFAISVAAEGASFTQPQVLLVDEPERALHPAAQSACARGFLKVAEDEVIGDVPVTGIVVATHSPAFLSTPGARLVRVSRRSDGHVQLDEIDPSSSPLVLEAELGLNRVDALLMVKTFVFVEGEHDLAILDALFAETFADRHAVIRAMRGAANLEAHLAAEHILGYSNANIRVVLDRIGAVVTRQWADAVEAFRDGERTRARRLLDNIDPKAGREARWLSEAGLVALQRGELDRIQVIGLERPDIINYLPVSGFVADAADWESLVGEWRRSTDPRPDFKRWLGQSKGARFDSELLGQMASTITDFADLERVVEGL